MSEILKLSNLKLNYGPISAIKGIDLTVQEGQIVAILGANGAGKTSTLKVISGLLKPTDGEIYFNGQKISGKPAHKVAQLGIMQSPGKMQPATRRARPTLETACIAAELADAPQAMNIPAKMPRSIRRRPGISVFPAAARMLAETICWGTKMLEVWLMLLLLAK